MCNIFSGHIVTEKGKNWGKVLYYTGIHHEKDRELIGDKYTKLVAWETVRFFDISAVKITHDCGQLLKKDEKEALVELVEIWLKQKGIKCLINKSDEIKNLERLDLRNMQITDISALSELKNLKILYLSSTGIKDISALSGLKNLKILALKNTEITDISALSELHNLKKLDLRNMQITDISALSELKNLRWLYLNDMKIKDISALSELKDLEIYQD